MSSSCATAIVQQLEPLGMAMQSSTLILGREINPFSGELFSSFSFGGIPLPQPLLGSDRRCGRIDNDMSQKATFGKRRAAQEGELAMRSWWRRGDGDLFWHRGAGGVEEMGRGDLGHQRRSSARPRSCAQALDRTWARSNWARRWGRQPWRGDGSRRPW